MLGGGSLIGGPSGIKSIQRGTITLTGVASNTATITSVDTANSLLRWLGESSNDAGVNTTERSYVKLDLTNATTVTATRTSATSNSVVSFEVVEYYPGTLKSVQRGTCAGAGGTATITAVDTTKATLEVIGHVGDATNFAGTVSVTRIALTNATTVTSTGGSAAVVLSFQVAEYY